MDSIFPQRYEHHPADETGGSRQAYGGRAHGPPGTEAAPQARNAHMDALRAPGRGVRGGVDAIDEERATFVSVPGVSRVLDDDPPPRIPTSARHHVVAPEAAMTAGLGV